MNKSFFIYLLLNLFSSQLFAQMISRSVINYGGGSYNSMFTFNAGEAIVGSQTFAFYADKGFIQPIRKESSINIYIEQPVLAANGCNFNSTAADKITLPSEAEDISIYNSCGFRLYQSRVSPGEINSASFGTGLFIITFWVNKQSYCCKFLIVER